MLLILKQWRNALSESLIEVAVDSYGVVITGTDAIGTCGVVAIVVIVVYIWMKARPPYILRSPL
jgi:hypothetical protein